MSDRHCHKIYHPALLPILGGSLLLIPALCSAQDKQETHLEEVIVTATLREKTLAEIAGTISVVSEQDIQAQLADGLEDLTRYQPGLSMDSSNRGGNEGFSIRGIGGNRVLTVIDGVRSADIYSAGPSSYGKDSFEVDDLKAVEIIRGPTSVLYGADAMGGAVLLRTKTAQDYLANDHSTHFALRSSFNSVNDQTKAGFTLASQQGDLGTVIQATGRDFSEAAVQGNGRLNPQDGGSTNWFWKTDWRVNAQHALSLTLDYHDETVETDLQNELSSSVSRSVGEDNSTRQRISLRHEWQLAGLFADSIKTTVHQQRSDAEQYTEQNRTSYAFINPANPATYGGTEAIRFSDFEFNQKTVSAQTLLAKQFDTNGIAHALIYGLNYETTDTERPRNRCDTSIASKETTCVIPSYPFAPAEVFPNKTFPDTKTVRTGAFVQDEILLFDGIRPAITP